MFEFDPATARSTFLAALNQVRLPGGPRIELAAGQSPDTLEVTIGQVRKTVARGQTVQLGTASRTVHVVEKPLKSDGIELDAPLLGAADEEVLPGADHGEVRFTTELSVVYHGEPARPARPEPAGDQEEGELM